MNERGVFAYEVVPIAERRMTFSFEEFVAEAGRVVETVFAQIKTPDGELPPLLVVGSETRIDAVLWTVMTTDFRESFLDRVVPATLDSLEPSRVALALSAQDTVQLSAVDIASDPPAELTLEGEILRAAQKPPQFGRFAISEPSVSPVIARALRRDE